MKKISRLLLVFLAVMMLTVGASVMAPAQAAEEGSAQGLGARFRNGVERFFLRVVPGDKSGAQVLRQSIQASEKLRTAQLTGEVNIDMLKDSASVAKSKLAVAGPVQAENFFDPQSIEEDLNMQGEVTMQGITLRAGVDMRLLENVFYFRFNELPTLPYFNANDVMGKWYKAERVGESSVRELTPGQQEQLRVVYMDLLKESQYSSAKKETKNGHPVFVIDVTMPKAALSKYVQRVAEISAGSQMNAEKRQEFEADLQKGLNQVGEVKATVWIDRSSFYVRHFELPLTITPDTTGEQKPATAVAGNPLAALSDVDQVKVLVSMDMDKFNESVAIEAPADAQPVEELSKTMFGDGMKARSPEGTSELPQLTEEQKKQLERYQKANERLDKLEQKAVEKYLQDQPVNIQIEE